MIFFLSMATAAEPCNAWDAPVEVARVQSSALDELSGIAPSAKHPGIAWVIEDSGNRPVVYALDLRTGETVGRIHLRGRRNIDWEEVRLGSCEPGKEESCIWVAEVGDNLGVRQDLALLRLEEPDELSGHMCLKAEAFPIRYPEAPQDSEALYFGEDGLPRLLSKRRDGTAVEYRMESLAQPLLVAGETLRVTLDGELPSVTSGSVPYRVTAADQSKGHLWVRTYEATWLYQDGVRSLLLAPTEPQGEALAVDPRDGALWWVSEGPNPPLYRAGCRTVGGVGGEAIPTP